jgi:hypothetical protein
MKYKNIAQAGMNIKNIPQGSNEILKYCPRQE